jgi:carbon storage regulator CsrA
MLVLSRRLNQKIAFPNIQTTVQVISMKGAVVRLGIDAPEHITVLREELLQWNDFHDQQVMAKSRLTCAEDQLRHLLNNRLNASEIGLVLLRRQLELGLSQEMSATLDKIESNLQNIKRGVENLVDGPASLGEHGRRFRALIVEDDRNECELLADFLRLAGLDVSTAGDGADALDHLHRQGKPDVVVLDMMMPRCDGPTTVRTIRGNPAYAGLRIFGVTGAAVEQFGLAEGPGGIDRWFRKPINPQALLRELNHNLTPAPASR